MSRVAKQLVAIIGLVATAAAVLMPAAASAGALARLTADLPDPPAPPRTHLTWVARSMRVNGLPMTVQAFDSRLAPDALFSHYESWSHTLGAAQTERVHTAAGPSLGIVAACCQITVQAQATISGSEGTITVSPQVHRVALGLHTNFPRPAATTLVNLQEYEDAGIESEHIALTSARSVLVEAHAFENLLQRDGWTLVRSSAGVRTRGAHVLEAQKGAQHALLTLLPDQVRAAATAIIIVWRKS